MSLGTLLLLVTVLALAFSHLITSRQLSAARKELVNYRYQYGVLRVGDPARPHVLRYADIENPWKWHVYVPKDKSYKLMCGVGAVPSVGVPKVSGLQHVQETWIQGDGKQTTIFVSLANLEPDKLKLSIGGEDAQTLSQIIPRTDVYRKSNFNQFSVGYREPFVAEVDAPFVIFYQTERSMKQSAAPDAMSNGVVVWMVPAN